MHRGLWPGVAELGLPGAEGAGGQAQADLAQLLRPQPRLDRPRQADHRPARALPQAHHAHVLLHPAGPAHHHAQRDQEQDQEVAVHHHPQRVPPRYRQ